MANGTIPLHNGRAFATMDRWHRYFVTVPELNKFGIYQPGVTSIIGMKDKSGPLTYWTASMCKLYAIGVFEDIQSRLRAGKITQDQAWAEMHQALSDMMQHYRDVKKEAADVGSLAHDYLHAFLMWREFGGPQPSRPSKDIDKDVLEKANNAIDAGMKFFTEHEVKPLTLETPVWSPTYGFIGTDDFEGMIDGELGILDYKSSKNIYPEVWLQTAAYQQGKSEEDPKKKYVARFAINICKEDVKDKAGNVIKRAGDVEYLRRSNEYFEQDLKAFLGVLEVYRWDRLFGNDAKGPIETIGALPALKKSRVKAATK